MATPFEQFMSNVDTSGLAAVPWIKSKVEQTLLNMGSTATGQIFFSQLLEGRPTGMPPVKTVYILDPQLQGAVGITVTVY